MPPIFSVGLHLRCLGQHHPFWPIWVLTSKALSSCPLHPRPATRTPPLSWPAFFPSTSECATILFSTNVLQLVIHCTHPGGLECNFRGFANLPTPGVGAKMQSVAQAKLWCTSLLWLRDGPFPGMLIYLSSLEFLGDRTKRVLPAGLSSGNFLDGGDFADAFYIFSLVSYFARAFAKNWRFEFGKSTPQLFVFFLCIFLQIVNCKLWPFLGSCRLIDHYSFSAIHKKLHPRANECTPSDRLDCSWGGRIGLDWLRR